MAYLGVLLAFCLLGKSVLAIPEDRTGDQVLKVANDHPEGIRKLISRKGLDVWSGSKSHLDILVPAEILEEVKKDFDKQGIAYSVMIKDLQKAIEGQNAQGARTGRRGEMDWTKYHDLNTIYAWLDSLAAKYPNRVTTGEIGRTAEKRPIRYVKVTGGRPGAKAVLIDGGIHAREWVSPASVTWVLQQIVENPTSLPKELLELDWYVVPVLNPDGFEYTYKADRMWRKNRSTKLFHCPGVDLNRNFDFKWKEAGTSSSSCSTSYGGGSAGSELETKAFKKFSLAIPNLKAYLTFHSYNQMILFPYSHAAKTYPADIVELKRVAEEAQAAIKRAGGPDYSIGSVPDLLYPATGGTLDWVKEVGKVKYSYAVELRDKGTFGFLLPSNQILPTARDALEVVKVVAAAAART